jgi:hypothetical protein
LRRVWQYAILSPVDVQNPPPLNRLLKELSPGLLADTGWLQAHGVTRSLTHDYVRRGLLERVGPRLYRRTATEPTDTPRWEVAILSAQQLNNAAIHLGGPTALSLLGKSHYLQLGGEHRVYVYDPDHSAPKWLSSIPLTAQILKRTKSIFSDRDLGLEWRRIDLGTGRLGAQPVDPKVIEPWDHFLHLSGEERSTLEMMDEIPENISFEHADEIFQGLTTLRPTLLGQLLTSCSSVKAKRLFFFFADRHGHAWARRLDRDSVDLGKGKRQLVNGGKFDPTYQITVPAEFLNKEQTQ